MALHIRPPGGQDMSSPSADRRELDTLFSDDIDAELALWKQLAFDTDMPQEQRPEDQTGQSTPNDDPSISQSSQFPIPPPQLTPEAYNYLMQTFVSLQGSPSHPYHPGPPTYPYPIQPNLLPNYNYPWPPPLPPTSSAGPSSFYPPIPLPPQGVGFSQFPPFPVASTSTAPAAQDPEASEDAASTTEDKRRRNTAASARFRAKKKVKTLNLERTVADLTGRTEELEREATDLRRENTWLKEIVLLKGRHIVSSNPGSQAAPRDQRSQDNKEDGTHSESESESTAKRRDKGKEKER